MTVTPIPTRPMRPWPMTASPVFDVSCDIFDKAYIGSSSMILTQRLSHGAKMSTCQDPPGAGLERPRALSFQGNANEASMVRHDRRSVPDGFDLPVVGGRPGANPWDERRQQHQVGPSSHPGWAAGHPGNMDELRQHA